MSDVLDELVEAADRGQRLRVLGLVFHLPGHAAEQLDVVGAHDQGIEVVRRRDHPRGAHLEQRHADERDDQHGRHCELPWQMQRRRAARLEVRSTGDRVVDGGVHQSRAPLGGELLEAQRARDTVVQAVVAVEQQRSMVAWSRLEPRMQRAPDQHGQRQEPEKQHRLLELGRRSHHLDPGEEADRVDEWERQEQSGACQRFVNALPQRRPASSACQALQVGLSLRQVLVCSFLRT